MYLFIQISQIMPVLVMAAQLLMALAILIILHEAGHFFMARLFGIRVEKFYLFFDAWGFKLFHFKKGDTEYGIGWLPMGGYVKIAGMIDESMDKEQMALPPKPDEFRSKPAWQRLLVMLGGVTINLILGIFIFWMLTLLYGKSDTPISSLKDGLNPGKEFRKLGMLPGDKIKKIGKKEVVNFSDLHSADLIFGGIDLLIDRNGRDTTIHVPTVFSKKMNKKNIEDFSLYPRVRTLVGTVVPKEGGFRAGLRKGDLIVGAEQTKVTFQDELQTVLKQYKNKEISLYIVRKGGDMVLPVQLDSAGRIGFIPDVSYIKVETKHFGFFPALAQSLPTAFGAIGDQAKGLGKIVKGEVGHEQLSGPFGIAENFGGTFDWFRFWSLTGLLSMILAFMNILPIPALDGGHVLFLLIEMVKGKPLSDKFLENAQMVGFFILVGLMVFIFGNDILKMFSH